MQISTLVILDFAGSRKFDNDYTMPDCQLFCREFAVVVSGNSQGSNEICIKAVKSGR